MFLSILKKGSLCGSTASGRSSPSVSLADQSENATRSQTDDLKSRWELSRERRTKARRKIDEKPVAPLLAQSTPSEKCDLKTADQSDCPKDKTRTDRSARPPIPVRADSTDDMIARLRRRLDQGKDQSDSPKVSTNQRTANENGSNLTEMTEKCRLAPEPVKRTGTVTIPSVRIRTKRAELIKPELQPLPVIQTKPEKPPRPEISEPTRKSSKSASSDEEVKVL